MGRSGTIADRVDALAWSALEASIAERGYARTGRFLTRSECRGLIELYPDDSHFRKRVDMARNRFGVGDYAYFGEPLPPLVAALREALYARLAPIANRMMAALGSSLRYPPTLRAFRARCRAAGQRRPTPLLLRYEADGCNRLHRDLYGTLAFPLQATALLSRPGVDYEGGEFLLVENRPRQQSLGEAIALAAGELILFPVSDRPVRGARGVLRASMRHGVSRVHRGERFALGTIFHDA